MADCTVSGCSPIWVRLPANLDAGYFFPKNLLPIADDPGGNQICISLADKTFGQVYFWAHDEGEPVDPDQADQHPSVYYLAPDFVGFTQNLEDDTEAAG